MRNSGVAFICNISLEHLRHRVHEPDARDASRPLPSTTCGRVREFEVRQS
jgi:hypothetical protein